MSSTKGKPVRPVYHCTICGNPLAWGGGRLRLVCGRTDCHGERPRPAPIVVREGDEHDRVALIDVGKRFFGSSNVHTFNEIFPLSKSPFLVVEFDEQRAGYLAYALHFPGDEDAAVVLMAVHPNFQGRGVGRALQGAFEAVCRPLDIKRLHITTTNDNIPGLYFYQRCGYRMLSLHTGAAAEAAIDHRDHNLHGFGDIPIRDEIHLVKDLARVVDEVDPRHSAGPQAMPDFPK